MGTALKVVWAVMAMLGYQNKWSRMGLPAQGLLHRLQEILGVRMHLGNK